MHASLPSMHPFDRYSPFTDVAALKEISGKSLRKSMRVNTLKCTVEEFKKWAASKKWMIEPIPWCKEGFFVDRVNRDEALGKDLLHILGYVYMQEAASMLPASLLDPQPGESILDMSAAPGSKTTQISSSMSGRGVVIANDVQEKRLWALLTNLQRCGASNAIVTRKVGQWFQGNMTGMFDRVLCDAPCTAQGTARKDSDALQYCSMDNIGKMAKLQRELLEAAVHAAKVGGRIVYSTCTLTPEENEEVVRSILNKFSEQLVVIGPEKWSVASGQWSVSKAIEDSEKVQSSLKKSGSHLPLTTDHLPLVRLWPQTYDTEGFFSAVIEKRAPTRDRTPWAKEPYRYDLVPKARKKEVVDRLEDWYGTSFMDEDDVLLTKRDQICVIPSAALDLKLPLDPYYVGLPFGKFTDHGLPRLSHEMATLRGHRATKQVLNVSELEMRQTMKGVNIPATPSGFDDGDVLMSLSENALGRPIIFGRGVLKNGIVLNRLPRDMVRMFA